MGRIVHYSFRAVSLLFLLGLIVTVALVLLAVGGPILLNIDILAEPTYTRVTDFMRRMLLYIAACAIGYIITSWGSRLTLPTRRVATSVPTSVPTSVQPWDSPQISRPQGSRPERPGSL